MTLAAYQAYFEHLATLHLAIAHNPTNKVNRFCVFEPDELADFAKINDGRHFSMALKKYEIRAGKNQSGQARKFYECGFVIFKNQPRSSSVDEKTLIQDEAEVICNDLWLRMQYEQEVENAGLGIQIGGRNYIMEISSYNAAPVAGLNNQGAGFDVTLTLSEFTGFHHYDPAKFSA